MNIFDKIIASVDPEKALKRQKARIELNFIKNSGYSHHGASKTKKALKGWMFKGGSPDDDITDNLEVLRQRSRDLYMGGAPLATGALKTARTNIVGVGLKLKPQVDAEYLGLSDDEASEIERSIEREFALWADSIDCDAERKSNFYELQQLALLSCLVSGDCFALLPEISRKNSEYDMRIRLIEADRVCNPKQKPKDKNISGGIEINNNGEVVAFHIAQWHPLSQQMKNKNKDKWVRIPLFGKKSNKRNVIHLMESERPEQRRGVPLVAPVIEALKQLGRYTEAELMAAVISGMFTVFIKSESPNSDSLLGEGVDLSQQVDAADEVSYELGNGAIVGLGENESVDVANPGRPNTAFDGFVIAILRQIGSALEIPYELLVKHFTASYSASRAALLEAWKMFRMRRVWLANDFCQPIYQEFLAEAIAKGRITAPGFFDDPLIRKAYCGAEWHGPSQGQIDPLKEVKAAELRVEGGYSTREKETAELTGGDWHRNHRQRVKEENLRREDNLIQEKNNEQVLELQPAEE